MEVRKSKAISIIVPIYNVEDCIVRCLDSLCRQSMYEIEIILVDDASTDRCGEICDEYAYKDDRFKVIHHTQNKGLSEARNTGLVNASCDYLMFVDSDDYVHEDFCRIPYECAVRNKADLVMFRFMRVDQGTSFFRRKSAKTDLENDSLLKSGYKTQKEALELLQCSGIGVLNAVWNKLYHKKVFDSIYFPTGYFYEDIGTTYKTILKANSIFFLDQYLYYYSYRADSITAHNTKKSRKDFLEMQIQQYCDLMSWGGYPREKLEELLLDTIMTYCIMIKKTPSDSDYLFCENLLCSLKTIPKNFTLKMKILFLLLKYCPSLFELSCTLFGKKC